jgi:hypothetical protein
MSTTLSTTLSTHRPGPPADDVPSARPSLGRRLRATAAATAGLVAVLAVAVAAVSAGAAPSADDTDSDHVDHAAMGAPMADDAPPLPSPTEEVGVLDLFGRPLLGPDGQPLEVALRPPEPRRPANAHEIYVPDGSEPTALVSDVGLLTAHAVTLNEVANDEGYTLVQRFDLFRANGLVSSASGTPSGADTYRAHLAQLDQQAAADAPSACSTAATVAGQSDGVPADLVAGLAVAQLHAEIELTRQSLGCPT